MNGRDGLQRLTHLVQLVDREDYHLLGVRNRLFGGECTVRVEWLSRVVEDDNGIDRLESFGAKFGRMQDTIVDKLVPAILNRAGEPVAAAIDNLARMERLALVESADDWLAMRGLRNRLVHEYIDTLGDLALTLERACRFSGQMHTDYHAMRLYATERLGVITDQ